MGIGLPYRGTGWLLTYGAGNQGAELATAGLLIAGSASVRPRWGRVLDATLTIRF